MSTEKGDPEILSQPENPEEEMKNARRKYFEALEARLKPDMKESIEKAVKDGHKLTSQNERYESPDGGRRSQSFFRIGGVNLGSDADAYRYALHLVKERERKTRFENLPVQIQVFVKNGKEWQRLLFEAHSPPAEFLDRLLRESSSWQGEKFFLRLDNEPPMLPRFALGSVQEVIRKLRNHLDIED